MNLFKIQFSLFALLGTIALFTHPTFAAPVKPQISVSNAIVTEGNSGTMAAAFTVTLSGPTTVPVNVAYATSNTTAVAPNDYNAVGNTLTFAPGETSKTVNVAVKGDTIDEVNETFNFNLSNPTNATINDWLGIGTINDDDDPPAVSVGNASASEGDSGTKTLTFTTRLSTASSRPVTVSAKTVAANATATTEAAIAGTDYVAVPATTLTFAPGELVKTIGVTVNSDTLDEADETFNLLLSAPGNATLGTATGVGTILDDDVTPTISVNDVTITEVDSGYQSAALTISLSAPSARTVRISAGTADGSATLAGADYVALPVSFVSFQPGQTSRTLSFATRGDLLSEATENFQLKLSSPSNATIADATGIITILDNDALPSISVAAPSVNEGNSGETALPFVLKLSAPGSRAVTVKVQTGAAATDSATTGVDYVAAPVTTVTIPAGATQQTFNVTVKGDEIDEVNEKLALNLSVPVYATLATTKIEGTIIDDDAAPTLSIQGGSVTEGNSGTKTVDFTVSVSAVSAKTITANFKTVNAGSDAATAGVDYMAVTAAPLTFAPGQTSKTVSVTVNGDTLYEANEKIGGALDNLVNASIAPVSGAATINDDDIAPLVSFELGKQSYNAPEGNSGNKTHTVNVKLSAPSGRVATVKYVFTDLDYDNYDSPWDATVGEDYVAQNGTLTFAPGETAKSISFVIVGDTIPENNESLFIKLERTNGTSIDYDIGYGIFVNIVDDDALPMLSVSDLYAYEGGNYGLPTNFTVTLSKASSKAVSVVFKTAEIDYDDFSGSYATSGTDFVPVTKTLVFAPGETSKTVPITLKDDLIPESFELFYGVLSNPVNAILDRATGTAQVLDNDRDGVGLIVTAKPVSITEGNDGSKVVQLKVSLGGSSSTPFTLHYATSDGSATADEDYVAQSGDIEFRPNQIGDTIYLTIKGDNKVEANETFNVTFSTTEPYTYIREPAIVTILNDDPGMSINSPSVTEGNSGTKTLDFTVLLSSPSDKTVSATFQTGPVDTSTATAGSDYVAIPATTLTFAPGETTKTVSVTINGDEFYEFDEKFKGSLINPVNGVITEATGVATITNDDERPYISLPERINFAEGNTTRTAKVTLSLSKPSLVPVVLRYSTNDNSATAGEDYTAPNSGRLTFAPGETSKDISFTIKGDTLIEDDEDFGITFGSLDNAYFQYMWTTSIMVTLIDDDATPALSIDSPTIAEGNSGSTLLNFTVTLSKPSGKIVTTGFKTDKAIVEPYPNGIYYDTYTASAGEDYVAKSSTISFAPGETSKTVSVVVNGDTLFEFIEQFSGILSNPVNATLAQATGMATITNDDDYLDVPIVTIENRELQVVEGDSGVKNAVVTVHLSAPVGYPVALYYENQGDASPGSDYEPIPPTILTFAPGETSKQIVVKIKGDTLIEYGESIYLEFYTPYMAFTSDGTAIIIIVDDDSPVALSINDAEAAEGKSGTSPLNFTVSLSRPSGKTVSVNFATGTTEYNPATPGIDYIAVPSKTVTFAPGETTQTVAVTLNGDEIEEYDELLQGILSNPLNATIAQATGIGTILNGLPRPSILFNYRTDVVEGNSGTKTAKVAVVLSHATDIPVSVQYVFFDGSAKAGEDYEATNGTLTFAPGETSKDIEFTVKGDTTVEADELFSLNLQYAQNAFLYSGNAVVVITNDDASSARSASGNRS